MRLILWDCEFFFLPQQEWNWKTMNQNQILASSRCYKATARSFLQLRDTAEGKGTSGWNRNQSRDHGQTHDHSGTRSHDYKKTMRCPPAPPRGWPGNCRLFLPLFLRPLLAAFPTWPNDGPATANCCKQNVILNWISVAHHVKGEYSPERDLCLIHTGSYTRRTTRRNGSCPICTRDFASHVAYRTLVTTTSCVSKFASPLASRPVWTGPRKAFLQLADAQNCAVSGSCKYQLCCTESW